MTIAPDDSCSRLSRPMLMLTGGEQNVCWNGPRIETACALGLQADGGRSKAFGLSGAGEGGRNVAGEEREAPAVETQIFCFKGLSLRAKPPLPPAKKIAKVESSCASHTGDASYGWIASGAPMGSPVASVHDTCLTTHTVIPPTSQF